MNYEHTEAVALAKRAVKHLQENTTDQAESKMIMPVSNYVDKELYAKEVENIFKTLPLALCLSVDVPENGSYNTFTILDIPIIVVRGKDGVVRALLNMCRHRGMKVCKEGKGKGTRFSCPYHAWIYDSQGTLVTAYDEDKFGELERKFYSLTELPCVERGGFIWVGLDPDAAFDINDWLGGMAANLDQLNLADWHLYDQRDLDGPGWKVTMDGMLECYHHNPVHGKTVGRFTIGNMLVWDNFEPHQRLVLSRKTLGEMADMPEDQWIPDQHIRRIHSIFPNLSISGVISGHCLVTQVLPSNEPGKAVTRQSILTEKPPETEEERAEAKAFSEVALNAVRDEDYSMGLEIESALSSGSYICKEFVYGKNEPGLQYFHKMVEKYRAD